MVKDSLLCKLLRGPLRLMRDCIIALVLVIFVTSILHGSSDDALQQADAEAQPAQQLRRPQQLAAAALPPQQSAPFRAVAPPRPAGAAKAVRPAAAARSASGARLAARPAAGGARAVKRQPVLDSRVYFPDLLLKRGLSGVTGIEVGAAKGRFSDFILHRLKPKHWVLIDPRLEPLLDENMKKWKTDPVLKSTKVEFLQGYSCDAKVLDKLPKGSFDFIYIDAAHDYENVKKEMPHYWDRLRKGGLLAGHDYCGKKSTVEDLPKKLKVGRPPIKPCGPYTDYAAQNPTKSGRVRKEGGEAKDQIGVVTAVLEWLREDHPTVELLVTAENFTRASLKRDGINYDDIITSTRNPSWYLFKP